MRDLPPSYSSPASRPARAGSSRGRGRRPIAAVTAVAALVLAACSSGTVQNAVRRAERRVPAAAGPSVPTPAPSPFPSSIDPQNDPVAQVVRRVTPAVVNVTTSTVSQDVITGGSSIGRAVGTGFVIRSDGVIVTNFHVVEGAVNIRVTLPGPDGRSFPGRVIGGDSAHDLAVLKVNGTGLPTVPLGRSSDLLLGERVVALGYALALPGGPTVTSGIISSLARTIQIPDPNGGQNGQPITRTYEDVLQTDAAINPGNSGGPLVDLAGNVVGINSAGASSAQSIGFSIAIDGAKPIIDRAIRNPAAPTAYLGVTTSTVGPGLAAQFGLPVDRGALVSQVTPGGPAARAGVRSGDVIVAFDGAALGSSDALGRAILAHRPGERATVQVVRPDGRRDTLTVTLGTRPLPTAP